ncbi:MAG TPA: sigma-70 family RNA polymerase sigma factor [Acidimicrobiales bacterium]|nr:sigma-70 family RNA polymerase sigma factor [Acidimicrobiales bacterium]
MAIRARSDNLSLDIPAAPEGVAAPVTDFAEVWAHREALRQACVRMIGDVSRAEDLVQDTFVSALKCNRRLDEGMPVAPWLKTVARRRSIDELRGRERVSLMADPPEPWGVTVEDPADHVVSQELVHALRSAIAELSVRERQLLLRQASYGMSLAELAAEEATSIASVRSVLARARQKLRVSLERGGVFGVLPLPRYLVTLRERLFRWGSQLEPTLPAMTGAGARFGEAMAAVITAIAMFLVGGGLPSFGGSSTLTTDLASAESSPWTDSTAAFGGGMPSGGGAATTTPPRVGPPGVAPLAPLPPGIDAPTFPNDGTTSPDNSGVVHLAASEDGQAILMSALSGSSSEATIFRSLDGGRSWARLTDDSIDHLQRHHTFLGGDLTVAPTYPADPRVYTTTTEGLVLRSEDGGLSFAPIVGARGAVALSPDFTTDDKLFIAGPPPGVYDDENDKVEPFSVLPPSRGRGGIAIGPDYADTGEILVGGTVDNGITPVSAVFTCVATGCTKRAEVTGLTGSIKVHTSRTAPGTVFVWNDPKLFRSTDGGYTFSEVTFPGDFFFSNLIEDEDRIIAYGLTFSSTAPMYVSTDGGATWNGRGGGSLLHRGLIAAITFDDGRIIASGSYMTGVHCSVDEGITWARSCPP